MGGIEDRVEIGFPQIMLLLPLPTILFGPARQKLLLPDFNLEYSEPDRFCSGSAGPATVYRALKIA